MLATCESNSSSVNYNVYICLCTSFKCINPKHKYHAFTYLLKNAFNILFFQDEMIMKQSQWFLKKKLNWELEI